MATARAEKNSNKGVRTVWILHSLWILICSFAACAVASDVPVLLLNQPNVAPTTHFNAKVFLDTNVDILFGFSFFNTAKTKKKKKKKKKKKSSSFSEERLLLPDTLSGSEGGICRPLNHRWQTLSFRSSAPVTLWLWHKMKTDSIYLTTFFLLCLACGLCPHLVNHENACAFTKKVGWFSNRTGTSVATAHAAKLPMRIQRECRIQTVPTPYWSFFLRAPLPLGSGSIAKAVYFISKTGWLDTYKEISEMEIGGLLCNVHVRITQNSVFCQRQPLAFIWLFLFTKKIK